MPANTPPAEETKQKILAVHDEDWLDEKLSELDEQYKGSIKDPALKLWLVAQNNGIEVEEIKIEGGNSGTPMVLAEITEEVIKDQMARGDRERDFFQVEGVVLNIRHGETMNKKPKCEFTLVDATGRQPVTAYASAIDLVAQSKLKEGEHVRLPLTQVLAKQFDADRRNPKGRLWYTLTLPPFGQIIRTNRDPDEVFKNYESDTMRKDDPVWAQGIVTHLQERHNDTCTVCNRWYVEGKEAEHDECEGMEIEDRVSYEATMVTGSGQYLKLRFGRDGKKPAITPKADLTKVYGFWTEKGNLQVHKYVVLAGPGLSRKGKAAAAAAPVARAPTKAPAAPPPARKPVARPPQPPAEEEPAEEPEEAPAPPPRPKSPFKRLPAPPPEPQEAEEEPVEEEAPAPPPRTAVRKPVAPVRKTQVPEPEPEEQEAEEEPEVEEAPAPPARRAPAKAPAAPPARPAAPKPAVAAPKAPAPARATAKAPVANGQVPEDFVAHVQKYCNKFGGRNRTLILINTAIQNDVIQPDDGEDEEGLKARIRSYIETMAEEGFIKFEDEKRLTVAWAS